MWIPQSAVDIERAARAGDLEETPSFDAKADLPPPKKNADLAIDVAAMTTEGGVLLYGVGEDEHKRPTVLNPLPLAGIAERVAQIVATSIAEVPYIDVREYPTTEDPAIGYIAVIVPQSARAPHQVTVGSDLRFYGRDAKGNKRLNEGEIARLYQRRQGWEQDRDALLVQAMEEAPFAPQHNLAYLHGFIRPVVPDQGIWQRAAASAGGRQQLRQLLQEAAGQVGPHDGYVPNLKSGVHWTQHGADECQISSSPDRDYSNRDIARYVVNVRMNIDGRGHLFCGRAGEIMNPRANAPDDHGLLTIFESSIAGNFAGFLASLGALYQAASYHGHVDLGLAATGLRGGFSATLLARQVGFYGEHAAYNADTYPRTERVAAAEIATPERVARRLLRHLFEALTGREDFDAFT